MKCLSANTSLKGLKTPLRDIQSFLRFIIFNLYEITHFCVYVWIISGFFIEESKDNILIIRQLVSKLWWVLNEFLCIFLENVWREYFIFFVYIAQTLSFVRQKQQVKFRTGLGKCSFSANYRNKTSEPIEKALHEKTVLRFEAIYFLTCIH